MIVNDSSLAALLDAQRDLVATGAGVLEYDGAADVFRLTPVGLGLYVWAAAPYARWEVVDAATPLATVAEAVRAARYAVLWRTETASLTLAGETLRVTISTDPMTVVDLRAENGSTPELARAALEGA